MTHLTGIRTWALWISSQVLFQLSHLHGTGIQTSLTDTVETKLITYNLTSEI